MKLKNYILLLVFYVFTILIVIYCCVIYKNSSKNVDNSFISNYVVDVTGKNYDELFNNINNYNIENHQFIIYVTSYKMNDLSSFEGNFGYVINDKNLKGKILYINVDDLRSFEFVNEFLTDFGYVGNVEHSSLPIFIVVYDNKVIDVKGVIDFNRDDIEGIVKSIYD